MSNEQSDPIDLGGVIRILGQYKLLISSIVLSFFVVSVGIVLYLPPIYRGKAVLAPASLVDGDKSASSRLGSLGSIASLAGISKKGDSNTTVAIATLRSRQFVEDFIKRHNLLPILFADLWDAEKKTWKVSDPAKIPTLEDGYRYFVDDVQSVTTDDETSLVTLTTEWTDGRLAVEWTNQIVVELNQRLQESAIVQSGKDIRFLEQKLREVVIPDVQNTLSGILRDRLEQQMLAQNRTEYAFKFIDKAQPEKKPIKPRKVIIVLFSMIAGFLLSLLIILFRENMRKEG